MWGVRNERLRLLSCARQRRGDLKDGVRVRGGREKNESAAALNGCVCMPVKSFSSLFKVECIKRTPGPCHM